MVGVGSTKGNCLTISTRTAAHKNRLIGIAGFLIKELGRIERWKPKPARHDSNLWNGEFVLNGTVRHIGLTPTVVASLVGFNC